jgi:hypothetical protein
VGAPPPDAGEEHPLFAVDAAAFDARPDGPLFSVAAPPRDANHDSPLFGVDAPAFSVVDAGFRKKS